MKPGQSGGANPHLRGRRTPQGSAIALALVWSRILCRRAVLAPLWWRACLALARHGEQCLVLLTPRCPSVGCRRAHQPTAAASRASGSGTGPSCKPFVAQTLLHVRLAG